MNTTVIVNNTTLQVLEYELHCALCKKVSAPFKGTPTASIMCPCGNMLMEVIGEDDKIKKVKARKNSSRRKVSNGKRVRRDEKT